MSDKPKEVYYTLQRPFEYSIVQALAQLRFVEREGKRILQQLYRVEHHPGPSKVVDEWRDVPLEIEA